MAAHAARRVLAARRGAGTFGPPRCRMDRRRRRRGRRDSRQRRVDSARAVDRRAGGLRVCVAAFERVSRRSRRSSQAARLVARSSSRWSCRRSRMYPSLFALATAAKERLIANEYAPQATSQREDLQDRLYQALDQIDALPNARRLRVGLVATPRRRPTARFARLVAEPTLAHLPADVGRRAVRRRRATWSAASRSPSRIHRRAVTSRRAATGRSSRRCSPFGSSERHVLRRPAAASATTAVVRRHRRARDARLPDAAVHLVPEPVSRVAAAGPPAAAERRAGPRRRVRRVRLEPRAARTRRAPSVWTLPDDVFARTVASREPFWTTLDRDDDRFRVYLPERSRRHLRARLSRR